MLDSAAGKGLLATIVVLAVVAIPRPPSTVAEPIVPPTT
jgi:hypothetical protein